MQQKRIHTNKAAVQMAFAPVKEFFAPGEFDLARPEMVFARPKEGFARPELCSARPLAGFRSLKMASTETKERDAKRYRSKNKRVACN